MAQRVWRSAAAQRWPRRSLAKLPAQREPLRTSGFINHLVADAGGNQAGVERLAWVVAVALDELGAVGRAVRLGDLRAVADDLSLCVLKPPRKRRGDRHDRPAL
jgi:hypothetical protein